MPVGLAVPAPDRFAPAHAAERQIGSARVFLGGYAVGPGREAQMRLPSPGADFTYSQTLLPAPPPPKMLVLPPRSMASSPPSPLRPLVTI